MEEYLLLLLLGGEVDSRASSFFWVGSVVVLWPWAVVVVMVVGVRVFMAPLTFVYIYQTCRVS